MTDDDMDRCVFVCAAAIACIVCVLFAAGVLQ